MRVRPLIDCIMSEIEPFFLFSDLGVNIDSINHYMFSIFSGLDYSESFHIRHLYDSGYLF